MAGLVHTSFFFLVLCDFDLSFELRSKDLFYVYSILKNIYQFSFNFGLNGGVIILILY